MKKYKVRVVWSHTIEDYADVEITAKNKAEAKKKAEKLCADDGLIDDENHLELHNLDWNDGEVVDGEYLVAADPIKESKPE